MLLVLYIVFNVVYHPHLCKIIAMFILQSGIFNDNLSFDTVVNSLAPSDQQCCLISSMRAVRGMNYNLIVQ